MKSSCILPIFSILVPVFLFLSTSSSGSNRFNEVEVGVILDMSSNEGRIVHSCVTMAVSDFYDLNLHYKSRIILHTRDSKKDPSIAISSALDLLDNIKVKAILGPETHTEAKLVGVLGDKAKVPTIFFSPTHFPTHPTAFQIIHDETTQFNGISVLLDSFKWRKSILLYEDTDYGRDILPYFAVNMRNIVHMSPVVPNVVDNQIIEELHRLKAMETSVFVVHMSPVLASSLFLEANKLGMMSPGYVWILTERTASYLDSSLIRLMQGVLGIRPYIPPSTELQSFTSRWKRKLYRENVDIERDQDPNQSCLLAYDTVWSLAKSVEKVATEKNNFSLLLVNEILQTRFIGLRGEFRTSNRRIVSELFEIVNLIGRAERTVGFWTLKGGIVKEMSELSSSTSSNTAGSLETILWPGGSVNTPKGWLIRMSNSKGLRIVVPQKPSFTELVDVQFDPRTNVTSFTGFCIEVFKAAINMLEYDVPFEFVPAEVKYNYQDMVHLVYLQEFDAAVGDFTIMSNRALYVEFTSPYTDLGVGTVARTDIPEKLWLFLAPLDRALWLTIATFFILTGFVVWKIEHPINQEFQGSRSQQIGTALWFSFSTLAFAHREKLLSNLSRFVVMVWVFVVLILTSSYTASLSSWLTVQQIELASKKGYNVGYQEGSFVEGVVVNNLNFKDPHLKPFHSPEQFAEALTKGGKNGGIDAIFDEMPYIKIFLGKFSDNHALIASDSTTGGFGFVFQKGSPIISDISRAIVKLREEGNIERMEHKWFKSESPYTQSISQASDKRVLKLKSFRGLFMVSGISLALALVVYYFYWLREQWNTRVENIVRDLIRLMMRYSTARYRNNLT